MRTSNKILIGLFVATLLVPTIIFTTLASRIKSGKLVNVNESTRSNVVTQAFQGVRYVSVRNLYAVHIYPSDSLRMETQRSDEPGIRFKQEGDSLVIYALQAALDKDRSSLNPYVYDNLDLYLPNTLDSIRLTNCEAVINGTREASKAPVFNLSLQGVYLSSSNYMGPSSDSMYYGRVFVHARESAIVFPTPGVFKDLQLELESSTFTINGNADRYDTLRINSDDHSNLTMPAKHLNKAILTSKK